jgi:hypothetical protein
MHNSILFLLPPVLTYKTIFITTKIHAKIVVIPVLRQVYMLRIYDREINFVTTCCKKYKLNIII